MNWTRGKVIGHGSSATVSIAKAINSDEIFAVKSANLSHADQLKREQTILARLNCPNIVSYKGFDITSEYGEVLHNLFIEYAPNGTLNDAIYRDGGRLDEGMIRLYTRQILQGLVYLHGNGIVHCDIKGDNILMAENGVKIADFGCARRINEATRITAGTPLYMAPEVARGELQGCPADIWALGCTIIEMATGKPPWSDISDTVSALYRIGFSDEGPEIPRFLSEKAREFLSKCLKRDPRERWSAGELLEHCFLEESVKLPLKEVSSCKWDTPTSVLDQGFWDSLEIVKKQSSTNSPKERIQQLCEEGCIEILSDWQCDENWVIVRSQLHDQIVGSACECEITSTSGADECQESGGVTNVSSNYVRQYMRTRRSLMAFRSSMYDMNYVMKYEAYCSNSIDIPLPRNKKSKII